MNGTATAAAKWTQTTEKSEIMVLILIVTQKSINIHVTFKHICVALYVATCSTISFKRKKITSHILAIYLSF